MKEQIESILNQRGNFELDLWVRDDGSTDATKKILMQYEIEKKLHWYEGRNLKPALSFMDLIKHCENYDYYAVPSLFIGKEKCFECTIQDDFDSIKANFKRVFDEALK